VTDGGLLAAAIESGPIREVGPGERGGAVECWLLWLQAERHRAASNYRAAHRALAASDQVAQALAWTHGTAPIWYVEAEMLRGMMCHDDGDIAAAAELLETALEGWRYIGAALAHPNPGDSDFGQAVAEGIWVMARALAGDARLDAYASELGASAAVAAMYTFVVDRFVPQLREAAARTIDLTAVVRSYEDARRLVNDLIGTVREWRLPSFDPVRFELGLRIELGGAAAGAGRHQAALAQCNDALPLLARLPPGPERELSYNEVRSNRGTVLMRLGRPAEAAAAFGEAEDGFVQLGKPQEALRARVAARWARAEAGEPVDPADLKSLLEDLERTFDEAGHDRGSLARDLEAYRRWYLVVLAQAGAGQLEEVIGLLETLRGDRPIMRAAADDEDPVLARLCAPFAVLGSRLRSLPDTVLLVLEPSVGATADTLHPPVVLTLSCGDGFAEPRWDLALADESLTPAMTAFLDAVSAERELLNLRALPIQHPASAALRDASATLWAALPAVSRDAVLRARTVICMPSSAAGLDRIPFELLRHDGGWLGMTHAVARCPSFQHLEEMAAPNARAYDPPARATVATVAATDGLAQLDAADADAATALRASSLLGLEPQLLQVASRGEARELFRGVSLLHYVGHGFAGELGEWLPVAGDEALAPAEVDWPDDESAPAVFFNACLLGRVRHVPGARQKGWALSLLDHGSPAVIGALAAVPDAACEAVTRAIYRAAWKAPLGEAMRLARERLDADGIHPLIGAAYVLHGDPNAVLSRAADPSIPRATAGMTVRWPSLATRYLATRAADDRSRLAERLEQTRDGAADAVARWVAGSTDFSQWDALIDSLLAADPEAAGAMRVLLGAGRLDMGSADPLQLRTTYLGAVALDDSYALAHMARRYRAVWEAMIPQLGDELVDEANARLRRLGLSESSLTPDHAPSAPPGTYR